MQELVLGDVELLEQFVADFFHHLDVDFQPGTSVVFHVVVDGPFADEMDGADEGVELVFCQETLDELFRGGADPFGLEANEDVDFVLVGFLETFGFSVVVVECLE